MLALKSYLDDKQVVLVDLRDHGNHILVELYVVEGDHLPMDIKELYRKLTRDGQDYLLPSTEFRVVKVEMKG